MVRRGKALCAAAVLSFCVTVSNAASSGADFAGERASLDARYAANWVLESGDHQGQPFAIVDKRDARIYVFEPQGRVLGVSPVLIGLAPGDWSAPDIAQRSPSSLLPTERTTPAGRFNTEPGHNDKGEDIVWVDYEASLAIHRLRPAPASERRAERLSSQDAAEHRISFGCVVVPVEFYERIVAASLGKRRGVVYVLPEARPVREMFGTLELSAAAAP
jgi:hypothetical protein